MSTDERELWLCLAVTLLILLAWTALEGAGCIAAHPEGWTPYP